MSVETEWKTTLKFFRKIIVPVRALVSEMVKRKIQDSIESNQKIVKLSSFGFTSARATQESVETPTSNGVESLGHKETPSKKHLGKFLESWKLNRPWLRHDPSQNLMFCDICIKAQVANVFTAGCDMFKKEAVTKHEKRTGTK
jgi:hypothetical protein